ncbi:MFS transporter [Bacillaceae bacterium Marseille-Q3522]|nr:MFS transporter [Bacillaceae bacterium Marseille-Q3522]
MKSEKLWKNSSFMSLWAGSAVSELGGAFGTFCNSVIIYELTGSKLALGSMWLLYFIPSLLLQLVIGPFIDKWSRKWTMIFSQWTRGAVFLFPLCAIFLDVLEPWHVYAVQLVVGLITPFYVPASQAITPAIISAGHLEKANAALDGMVRLMTFLAPILGGIIVEYISVKLTLVLVCCFLFISGFLLLFLKEKRARLVIRQTWLEQFVAGFAYFFRSPTLVWLGIFLAIVQFAVGVTMVINLPFITEELSASYDMYGLFMAGFPLGFVIGSFFVGKTTFANRRFLMLGSLVVGGITYMCLTIIQHAIFAVFTEVIAGVALAYFSIYNRSILQRTVPDSLMGKVLSVRMFIYRAGMPLGIVTGGVLSEQIGIRPLYLLIGLFICLSSLAGLLLPYFQCMEKDNGISS